MPATLSAAPVQWLWIGIGVAVAGIVIPLLLDGLVISIVGWLLGGAVAVLLLAIFIRSDAARLARGWARPSGGAAWLRHGLVVLAASAVALNAWQMADVLARKEW